jgi:hypothetical protein
MSILNYFFIGTAVAFILDLLLGIEGIKNHPKVTNEKFGWGERIMCVLIWPVSVLIFIVTLIKTIFNR